jgi:hypothetical protein
VHSDGFVSVGARHVGFANRVTGGWYPAATELFVPAREIDTLAAVATALLSAAPAVRGLAVAPALLSAAPAVRGLAVAYTRWVVE